jgi:hypothetical protein
MHGTVHQHLHLVHDHQFAGAEKCDTEAISKLTFDKISFKIMLPMLNTED